MKQGSSSSIILEFKHRRKKMLIITIVLLIILLALAILSLMIGNTFYTLKEVITSIFEGGAGSFTIQTLRLPRMLNGVLCGIAFGMAGNTFQKLLGNPLASPDIIGVSSGASVGAIFCILVLQLSGPIVSVVALISGLFTALLLFYFARREHFSNERMILIGIGMQAFLSAFISYLILQAAQYDVASALRWLSGSLNQVTMQNAGILALCVISVGSVLVYMGRSLLILELGDSFAVTLGLNIKTVKRIMFLCAIVVIAFATSVSGPIAAVAFLSGPIASKLYKGNGSNLIQAGLVGAILVLGAQLLAQNMFEARYPVGVITGIIGAPYLLLQLFRMNKKGSKG